MAVVTVAGPPTRATQPRVGFPYVLPLSVIPPPEWAQHFDALDWAGIDPRLRPPRNPRLEGARVWLPGIADVGELTEILDIVTARIDEVDRAYEQAVAEKQQLAADAAKKAAERRAQETAAFEEWASTRPKPPDES